MGGPLLSPKHAGAILGVSTSRTQQLEREGKLHAQRDSLGRRLFREIDVLRFARERERRRDETVRQAKK